jgi:hypothetical protein
LNSGKLKFGKASGKRAFGFVACQQPSNARQSHCVIGV